MNKKGRKIFMFFGIFFIVTSFSLTFCEGDIFDAIDRGDLKQVKSFINKKDVLLVNKSDSVNAFAFGETLLNAACYKGNLEIIKEVENYLRYMGGKKYGYLKDRHSSIANKCKSEEFIESYLKNRVNMFGAGGQAPLHCACFAFPKKHSDIKKSLDVVKYLISIGANVNTTNNEKKSPVDLAFEDRNFDLIMYLVKNGAKINEKFVREISVGASDKDLLEKYLKKALKVEQDRLKVEQDKLKAERDRSDKEPFKFESKKLVKPYNSSKVLRLSDF